ncbi:hypothetical protein KIL84_000572 [Mauremys mutica]|uniref:Uncharacterized protein n=1 Tax=Mauremys mutica TaxID=74926 RepID=A0A9D4ANL6_9SAUR|nr:hypothetical protein KIL84_000572 [Mauremys mutica]
MSVNHKNGCLGRKTKNMDTKNGKQTASRKGRQKGSSKKQHAAQPWKQKQLHTNKSLSWKRRKPKKMRRKGFMPRAKWANGQIPQSPGTPSIQGTPSQDRLCPAYKKEVDCIGAYFTTFERLCEFHKLPEDKEVP